MAHNKEFPWLVALHSTRGVAGLSAQSKNGTPGPHEVSQADGTSGEEDMPTSGIWIWDAKDCRRRKKVQARDCQGPASDVANTGFCLDGSRPPGHLDGLSF